MPRLATIIALVMAGAVLSGCTGQHPRVREGDADSVEVDFSGDIASAWPLARRHCAQFERVPRLANRDAEARSLGIAEFACVKP